MQMTQAAKEKLPAPVFSFSRRFSLRHNKK
jgi:hypothetical protein